MPYVQSHSAVIEFLKDKILASIIEELYNSVFDILTGKDLRKVMASIAIVLLLCTVVCGCIGNGDNLISGQATDLILDEDDVPGSWHFETKDEIAGNVNTTNRALVEIRPLGLSEDVSFFCFFAVLIYNNTSQAESMYDYAWGDVAKNGSLPNDVASYTYPALGDEAFTIEWNSSDQEVYICFRLKNVLAIGGFTVDSTYPVTADWLLDLMEIQESKLEWARDDLG